MEEFVCLNAKSSGVLVSQNNNDCHSIDLCVCAGTMAYYMCTDIYRYCITKESQQHSISIS